MTEALAEAPREQAPIRLPNGQFPPGVSGNPKGRAKELFTRAALRNMLVEETGESEPARKLMARIYQEAMAGDMTAARLLIETIQGKPTQDLEHSGSITSVRITGAGEDSP